MVRGPRRSVAVTSVAVLLVVGVAACSGNDDRRAAPTTGSPRPVVATGTALVAQLVTAAAGSAVTVVEAGESTRADLVVVVGLGYEQARGIDVDAPADARVLALAERLAPAPYGESPPYATVPTGNPPGSAPALGAPDPAFWLDPDRATRAVELIAEVLVELGVDVDPLDRGVEAWTATMAAADEGVQAVLADADDTSGAERVVVTDQATLGVFAVRYGVTLRAPGPGEPAAVLPDTGGVAPGPPLPELVIQLARAVAEATPAAPDA